MPPKLKLLTKVAVSTAFIALCVGINAIAFTEIKQSLQARRTSPTATANSTSASNTSSNAAQSSAIQTSESSLRPSEPTNTETVTPEPVTIQNTATIEPQSNQIVSVPPQPQRSNTRISLRPVSSEGFINDPQPIQITPVVDEALAENSENVGVNSSEATADSVAEMSPATSKTDNPTETATAKSSANPASQKRDQPQYGHFPYEEGNADEMTLIASYSEGADSHRAETLHPEAATALLEMIAAARVDGIWIIPASGFRTIAEQRTLFNAQIERKGSPEVAAKVSAPPGYSEHHTGYAVDLADGALPPSQDISDQFAQSPAYQWLLKNAQNHGFELSFPENNPQGIAFEPWHWRYVGSERSREQLKLQTPATDTRNTTNTFIE